MLMEWVELEEVHLCLLVILLMVLVNKQQEEEEEEPIFLEEFTVQLELELQIMHQKYIYQQVVGCMDTLWALV